MSIIEDEVMVKQIEKPAGSGQDYNEPLNDSLDVSFLEGVTFDDTIKQMEALKAHIFDTPENNETKLQFIKEELSTGRYQIHSQHIAAKLLEYAHTSSDVEIA